MPMATGDHKTTRGRQLVPLKVKKGPLVASKHFPRIALMVLATIITACAVPHSSKPGMTFTSSKCLGASDLGHFQPDISARWEDGKFLVSVRKPVICNAEIVKPTFEVDGARLIVAFKEKLPNAVTKCYCDTESVFSFTGLPASSYEVFFEAK